MTVRPHRRHTAGLEKVIQMAGDVLQLGQQASAKAVLSFFLTSFSFIWSIPIGTGNNSAE